MVPVTPVFVCVIFRMVLFVMMFPMEGFNISIPKTVLLVAWEIIAVALPPMILLLMVMLLPKGTCEYRILKAIEPVLEVERAMPPILFPERFTFATIPEPPVHTPYKVGKVDVPEFTYVILFAAVCEPIVLFKILIWPVLCKIKAEVDVAADESAIFEIVLD